MYLGTGDLTSAQNALRAFINQVKAQSGKAISLPAATLLVTDAQWVMAHPG